MFTTKLNLERLENRDAPSGIEPAPPGGPPPAPTPPPDPVPVEIVPGPGH